MEKMGLVLNEYEAKKTSLNKMCKSLHSQASSMLVFSLQWKELEERLDSIRDEILTQLKELNEREQQLDVKELRVQSKITELVELKKLIDEKQKEATNAKKCLKSLQVSIKHHTERNKVLEDNERQMERRIQELNGIVKSIEEKLELARKEEKKAFDRKLEEEKLKEPKKSVVEAFKTIRPGEDIMRKIQLKVKDNCLHKKSLEEWSCNLERKERELKVKEQQVLLKAEEVDALNKKTFKEFQKMVKELEEDSQRLQQKERLLEVKNQTIKLQQEGKKQLEVKETELEMKMDTIEKLHQEREKQLKVKKRKLEETNDTMETLHQEHEKQFKVKTDAMEKLLQEREKQLEAKEKQLEAKRDTMTKLHQEREKQLGAKERQLEENGKELEFRKKQFGSQIKVNSEPLEVTSAANANERSIQQKKHLYNIVDPKFQQHQHNFQRTSLSADRPPGLHPNYPIPGSSFYNGQFSIPFNNYPVQLHMPANGPIGNGYPRFGPQNPY